MLGRLPSWVLSCFIWMGAGVVGAWAGQVVILSSTIAEYTPGSIVDGASTVALPAGGMLMFNDATGATQTLSGPYSGAIEQSTEGGDQSEGSLASLSRLVTSREEAQTRLGAIRALPNSIAHQVDVVSVARSAVQCAQSNQPVSLWRPETLRGDTKVTIADLATGASAEILWPDEDASLPWPDAVPIRDRAPYRVRLDLSPRPVEITLRLVPEGLETKALTAAWMAEAGCRRQALLLVSLLGE